MQKILASVCDAFFSVVVGYSLEQWRGVMKRVMNGGLKLVADGGGV